MSGQTAQRSSQKETYSPAVSKNIRGILRKELLIHFGFEHMFLMADVLIDRFLRLSRKPMSFMGLWNLSRPWSMATTDSSTSSLHGSLTSCIFAPLAPLPLALRHPVSIPRSEFWWFRLLTRERAYLHYARMTRAAQVALPAASLVRGSNPGLQSTGLDFAPPDLSLASFLTLPFAICLASADGVFGGCFAARKSLMLKKSDRIVGVSVAENLKSRAL